MTVPAWLPSTVVFFLLLLVQKGEATTCRSGDCTGLIITGGVYRNKTDVEIFPAKANCTIPPFPSPGREDHSLSVINDTLVACGGYNTKESCISWKRGQDGWEDFHTLGNERYFHAAVVVDGEDQIIVLGGGRSSKTGEIVRSGRRFALKNSGSQTCAVSYQGAVVMMGGGDPLHGKVDRYDSEGNYLDSLPDLLEARSQHACTTFKSSNGEEGLLVTGGSKSGRLPLSSTELYLPSKNKWTRGGDLPRTMRGVLRAAQLSEHVVVTGGTGPRHKVLQYEETAKAWTEIGKTKRRSSPAVVPVDVSQYCPGTKDANSNNDNSDNSSTTLTASWFALAVFFTLFL